MRQDKKRKTEEYTFIKETIKKKHSAGWIIRRIILIAGCSVLTGFFIFWAVNGTLPGFLQKVKKQDKVVLSVPSSENQETKNTYSGQMSDDTDEISSQEKTPLELYEDTYKEALKVSEKSMKALVTVTGISDDEDLLDSSFLNKGNSEGIIFLETDTYYYILTYNDELADIHRLQIVFSDGTETEGELCMGDDDTGIAVARVEKSRLRSGEKRNLSVAELENGKSLKQSDMVIAIGRPAGDDGAIIYGMVTSVSEKMQAADTEYNIIATDIHGSQKCNGVLLDSAGNVAGVILKQNDKDSSMVHALEVSQILPQIERLSNGSPERYTGIYGTSLGQLQCEKLGIETGLYVENVAAHSPAMDAGIQSGDVISSVDGHPIGKMPDYYEYLQTKSAGDRITLSIMRKNQDGKYVRLDYELAIEER